MAVTKFNEDTCLELAVGIRPTRYQNNIIEMFANVLFPQYCKSSLIKRYALNKIIIIPNVIIKQY